MSGNNLGLLSQAFTLRGAVVDNPQFQSSAPRASSISSFFGIDTLAGWDSLTALLMGTRTLSDWKKYLLTLKLWVAPGEIRRLPGKPLRRSQRGFLQRLLCYWRLCRTCSIFRRCGTRSVFQDDRRNSQQWLHVVPPVVAVQAEVLGELSEHCEPVGLDADKLGLLLDHNICAGNSAA